MSARAHPTPLLITPATLRAWRDARGWTRTEAAQAFGVPAATLAGLEAGRRPESPLFGPLTRLIALLDERDAR